MHNILFTTIISSQFSSSWPNLDAIIVIAVLVQWDISLLQHPLGFTSLLETVASSSSTCWFHPFQNFISICLKQVTLKWWKWQQIQCQCHFHNLLYSPWNGGNGQKQIQCQCRCPRGWSLTAWLRPDSSLTPAEDTLWQGRFGIRESPKKCKKEIDCNKAAP